HSPGTRAALSKACICFLPNSKNRTSRRQKSLDAAGFPRYWERRFTDRHEGKVSHSSDFVFRPPRRWECRAGAVAVFEQHGFCEVCDEAARERAAENRAAGVHPDHESSERLEPERALRVEKRHRDHDLLGRRT